MSDPRLIDRTMGRRAALGLGTSAAVGALSVSLADGASAAGIGAWPKKSLPATAAKNINKSQFFTTKQLATWGAEADALGLRATGAANTEGYLRKLENRLKKAGLQGVRREPVPMTQWLAKSWSLEVDGRALPHTFYMPYTQRTSADGVTAPMTFVTTEDIVDGTVPDVSGKIVVFEVDYTKLALAGFALLSYPGGFYSPGRDTAGDYNRPWFNSAATVIDALIEAGAAGVVGIWNELPGSWARQYTPYDGILRTAPGIWVDKTEGPALIEAAGNNAPATIKLQATVKDVITHNVVGFIPGRSRELTVLHTHTDGTNGMEENGQIGILATAQYMARLPRKTLSRTVMVLLTTGHFAGGVGIKHFLKTHAGDLVPRITSILTLEHLGCTEWLPDTNGRIRPTGRTELGAYFTPNAPALVKASIASQNRVGITGTVARPFVPSPADAVQPLGWPGEGTYWWWYGSIPTSNYITGPYGLITADLKTRGMVDYRIMRQIAMSTVRTTLDLANSSRQDLRVV